MFLLALQLGGLVHVLHHYDTLKTSDLRHHFLSRHKRSAGEEPPPYPRQMEFSTLGQHFHLYLEPRTGLLSPKFKAYGVDSRGNVKYEQINKHSFYTGQVLGEPGSTVEAHLEDDGVLSARVTVGEDIYFIEPSWRHLPSGENVTMISYRARDVKFNFTAAGDKPSPGVGFCAEFDDDQLPLPKTHRRQSTNDRPRRQTGGQPPQFESPTPPPPDMDCDVRGPAKNTCPMLLVADYRFFQEMGQRSLRQTINYLINLVEGVDRIFRCTQWGKDMGGFGFEIQEIKVHEEPTPEGGEEHYNMDMKGLTGVDWQVRDLLANFSLHDYSKFCLAHLFTYQDFDNGVLGLGWVGTDRKQGIGGICTEVYRKQEVTLYLNTGLTSTLNWKRRILTREADLVTAHELGHNFGSEHDTDNLECSPNPEQGGKYIMYQVAVSGEERNNKHDTDNLECSPNPEQGGKYIMYQVAVSGEERNNKLFSNCSKRAIYKVLSAKHSLCFVEPQKSLCGNYRVEEGEDCDAGHLGNKNTDPCCTRECKFRGNAVCRGSGSEFLLHPYPCRITWHLLLYDPRNINIHELALFGMTPFLTWAAKGRHPPRRRLRRRPVTSPLTRWGGRAGQSHRVNTFPVLGGIRAQPPAHASAPPTPAAACIAKVLFPRRRHWSPGHSGQLLASSPDNNSPCCLNCTFSPSSYICRQAAPPEDDATCKQAAYCTYPLT
ncbi:Disintegrin and metalloproteinase domain-containing protein 17 [Branchiostoma belcheri]|nr:Disintegrin and metalloproteinase domain-containing protein 17 [Branchiostoma belcheri]